MAPSADPEEVWRLVEARPGVPVAEVARALAVDHSTALYHLRRLARVGRVVSEREGRCLRWFVNGCGLCPVLRWLAPVTGEEDAVHAVLAALPVERGVRAVDVHRSTGLGLPSVRWHLEKLVDRQLVVRAGYGRFRRAPWAKPCVAHALQGSRCGEWDRCAMSRRWTREET